MTKPKAARAQYLVTFPMGLDGLVMDELQQKVPGFALEARTSRDICFAYDGSPADLLSLRSVSDAWLVLWRSGPLGPRFADLRLFAEQMAKLRLEDGITSLRAAGFRPKHHMTFVVNCSLRGQRAYRRVDAIAAVERALVGNSAGRLRPVRENADLRLWLHIGVEETHLCLALAHTPLGLRQRAASLPTALPAPVAYAMAALTKPRPDDVFLDPMCGTGSIALERAENWRHALILAGDREPQAVAAVRENFGPRHRPREFLLWDATALPLPKHSVSAAACNPPHGVQMRPAQGIEALYRGFLAEAGRVLKPFALLTFLTPERQLTDRLLREAGGWSIERCFVIDLLGQRPYLYVLRRML